MSKMHMVRRGDSLWRLAEIYLGTGTKWPDIMAYHNEEAAKLGRPNQLLRIKYPNLIYVGQTIMVPFKEKKTTTGNGKKPDASTPATGIGLKMEYNFESGKNPITYQPVVTKDYTITTEMTGKITIENLTHNGFRHNFEIVMTADKNELSSKMEFADKAIAELTKSVEPSFDIATGSFTLKASIAAQANIGPYIFKVESDAPNHFTSTFKPEAISAIVEKGKRRYKYVAEIAFKVDVTLHPTQKKPEKKLRIDGEEVTVVTAIGLIAAYIIYLIYGPKGPILEGSPASNMPFFHYINSEKYKPMA